MPESTQKVSGWSDAQQRLFLRAARAADWNDAQRYMAMKHMGCPLLGEPSDRDRRPSVKHPRNTNAHFDFLMGLAEAHALTQGRGDKMPRRRAAKRDGFNFWRDVSTDRAHRMRKLVEQLAGEAHARLPIVFAPGFLAGFILRMTMKDEKAFCGEGPGQQHLIGCDEGQVYRVLEGLKAWVARKFAERGMRIESLKRRDRTPSPAAAEPERGTPDAPAPISGGAA